MSWNSSRTSVEWFQNYSRNVLMVCSRTVLELTLVCSRTDLEQTFRIFWNNCRTPLKMSHLTFYKCLNHSRTFLEWFQNNSRNILMVSSRTVKNKPWLLLELIQNEPLKIFMKNCRTTLQKSCYKKILLMPLNLFTAF